MKKTLLLGSSIFLWISIACTQKLSKNAVEDENERPNLVVFLCDDLGYGDLQSYGHPHIKTPNLDKLAATGIRLTNFYSAAPVCSPSRVGLLTGRSPNRAGIYDFIIGGKRKRNNNRDLVHLQQHEATIPAKLKSVGYETCLSGKWHCSSMFNSEVQPQPDDFGFDHWFATHNNAAPSHENPRNFVRNGEEVGTIEGFSCQIVVDEAITWLDKKESDSPFFIEIAFHEPHVPIASPPALVQKHLGHTRNENEAQFFANVENVDLAVGRLVDYIDKNISGNTLIIFTSDNGPEALYRYEKADRSYGSPGPLRGMKLWTYDGGFRVPCIINWRGKKGFTGTSDAVVSALDFMPTFCEIVGADLPEKELDGQSLARFLKDGTMTREKPLLWSFYNAMNSHVLAMRDGDWKIMAQLRNEDGILPKITNVYDGNEDFVKDSKMTNFLLFNLKEDTDESINRVKDNPKVFQQMKSKLESEYAELLTDSHIWTRE